MGARIIDGRQIARVLKDEAKVEAAAVSKRIGRPIGLSVVMVGDDPASEIYIKNKVAACNEAGINSVVRRLPLHTAERQLLDVIDDLNGDNLVDGILVQLPLPKHISAAKVLERIDPKKDVDGFSAQNQGLLCLGLPSLNPCTPLGIMHMLRVSGVEIAGKNAVVVGRSGTVGRPVAQMLMNADATVTVCHSKTADIKKHTLSADILVVCVGRAEFISGDMVKKGAVVVDVGTNRLDGKLLGDVHFDTASEAAGMITPVPGGVGPVTIAMLLKNTIDAALRRLF